MVVSAGVIDLNHRESAGARTARERGINPRDIELRQLHVGRDGILFDVVDAGRFGDGEDGRPQREKCADDANLALLGTEPPPF